MGLPEDLPPSRLNLVVGKFAPLHKGHQLLLERALQDTTGHDFLVVLVYSNPDFPEMPSRVRAEWVRQLYPQARVHVPENPPPNDADDLTHREFVRRWLEAHYAPHLENVHVYTSEGYGEGFARHLGARHVAADPQRRRFPISGSRLREWLAEFKARTRLELIGQSLWTDYGQSWEVFCRAGEWLDERVWRSLQHWYAPVQRVVFLGAESTGKTTLARRMAQEYGTGWVAEYGREHYERRGGVMELSDYLEVAHRHRELEDEAAVEARNYLFVDTNALTTLFFSYYYNQSALLELHALARECAGRYHHTFVCADDIPFEQDGWRDNETWRGRMQGLVLHDLDVRGVPYTVVRGSLEQRVAQVRAVLEGRPLPAEPPPTRHLGPRPA
ncbi:AAA family ATPase [Calidithermus chliarophilus]|uniref:AAA family ATPase n=1 Tax=Calidithermus chliarophilus TaxID=52023 RepID=UPI000424FCA8|nr:AAA family ATPase [Calidithermus chliarophilus]